MALDGIAIIVNGENSVTDLSLEQIASIYTGEVTDWSEFGSEAGTIAKHRPRVRLRHPRRL